MCQQVVITECGTTVPSVQKETYQVQIASSKTSGSANLCQNDTIHKG